jgi:hypothetical protein
MDDAVLWRPEHPVRNGSAGRGHPRTPTRHRRGCTVSQCRHRDGRGRRRGDAALRSNPLSCGRSTVGLHRGRISARAIVEPSERLSAAAAPVEEKRGWARGGRARPSSMPHRPSVPPGPRGDRALDWVPSVAPLRLSRAGDCPGSRLMGHRQACSLPRARAPGSNPPAPPARPRGPSNRT